MHHRIDTVLGEDGIQRRRVADIAAHEFRCLAAQPRNPLQHFWGAVREIIEADHLHARVEQAEPGV